MDKDLLIETLKGAKENVHTWSLYFFKIEEITIPLRRIKLDLRIINTFQNMQEH